MPWKEKSLMESRLEFVHLVKGGQVGVAEACRRYGISRKTGYKWLGRFATEKLEGLKERSSTPHSHPQAMGEEVAHLLFDAKLCHPTWGPRKVLDFLRNTGMEVPWPAASSVGALFRQYDLVRPYRRRSLQNPKPEHLQDIHGVNSTWCADYKGQFLLGNGQYCYPLTITDGYSRFLLACGALKSTCFALARRVFERAFQEFGLPRVLRTDNGSPFASTGLRRLSRLNVWLIRLGITPEQIRPGHPEENGRHERMHRTLLEVFPPRRNFTQQQIALDDFREEYNTIRPHEALQGQPPAAVYRPSLRPFPKQLPELVYPTGFERRRVRRQGDIKFRGRSLFLSEALRGEEVGIEMIGNGQWRMHLGPFPLGDLDERTWTVVPYSKVILENLSRMA